MTRRVDPAETVALAWARARRLDPDIHAFASLPAQRPQAGSGRLAGVAVGVKDLFDTADMPTTYGAAIYAGHRPAADAAIVAALRDCGATILGKTVTTEFAHAQPGPTRNPWNLAHTPGGSSSGSAAAVAAGIVPLAIGTQTMGSIIRPAAFCGIVGFKPTFGLLPRTGVHPLCDALDHVGLFARAIADIVSALVALGHLADAAAAQPARPFRFGLLPTDDPAITPAQRAAVLSAANTLRQAGHRVDAAAPPDGMGEIPAIVDTLLTYDAARYFASLVARHGEAVSAPIRDLVARGRAVTPADHAAALTRQTAFVQAHRAAAAPFDVLLTVPAPGEAPRGLASTGDPRFCAPWSVAGVPALTVPIGFGPAGLPLGLQLVGHWGEDARLLQVAEQVARLFPPVVPPPAYRQDFGNSI